MIRILRLNTRSLSNCRAGVPINDVLVRFKDLTITGQVEIKTHKSPHVTQQLRDATKVSTSRCFCIYEPALPVRVDLEYVSLLFCLLTTSTKYVWRRKEL